MHAARAVLRIGSIGASLVVQRLRLRASTAGSMGSIIPGWGTKIPHAAHSTAKKKKKKNLEYE